MNTACLLVLVLFAAVWRLPLCKAVVKPVWRKLVSVSAQCRETTIRVSAVGSCLSVFCDVGNRKDDVNNLRTDGRRNTA